jgi:hypothetical protein
MNSTAPVEKMQTATVALSWVVGLAFLCLLILALGILRWNPSAGDQSSEGLVPMVDALGPVLAITVVALEATAVILLACGFIRWRFRFLGSVRCVLCMIGIAIIGAAIALFYYAALVTAIDYP